ncbi:MAG: thioredoxin family protein [Crocinitomicaceae bacterium]
MNKAIYFRGDQCSVCSVLYPKVKTHIETQYPELDFQTMEGEELEKMAAQYGVYTAPVLLVFFDGKEHSRFVRNFSGRDIDDKIGRVYGIMFR